MGRALFFALGTTLLVNLPTPERATAAASPPEVTAPVFSPANFGNSTQIDNPYFPLRPGTTFVYEGTPRGQGQRNEVQVTHDTRTIQGVNCVVVHDRVWAKGQLLEDTFDWYAQDRAGNVWYMGEQTTEYKNGVSATGAGSWEAGVNGARPGYLMEAHPQAGDAYQQEFLAGEAEDNAAVTDLSQSVSVPYGSWSGNVLVTREWTPLERAVLENKFYALGVGMVKVETTKGGSEVSELVAIRTE
jgi:hypothetical protein